jgi:hypothetical protein
VERGRWDEAAITVQAKSLFTTERAIRLQDKGRER